MTWALSEGEDMTDQLNKKIEEVVLLKKEVGKFRTCITNYLRASNVAAEYFPDAQRYAWSIVQNPEILLDAITERIEAAKAAREEKERIKALVREIMNEGTPRAAQNKTTFSYPEEKA